MVKNMFIGGTNFLTGRQNSILSAAFIIMVSIVASRILGLVRYRMLAANFGSTPHLLDSFIAASAVPEAIFEIFIFGAVSVAFIPVFSSLWSHNKKEEAWNLASSMVNISIIVFLVLGAIVFLTADGLAKLVVPGLDAASPQNAHLIGNLIKLMLISQIFFVAGTFLTSLLQSFHRFLIPAMASIFYNVGIILGIIFLVPVFGIYGPAIGMSLGAMLFMVLQIPLAYTHGFRFRLKLNFDNSVKSVLTLMVPRSLSLAAVRINDLVNVALASLLSAGSIVVFNFAQVLALMPIALFGGSVAQASLPTLANLFSKGKVAEFKSTFASAFNQILFFTLPSAAILSVLRIPVVRLVYGASEFPWDLTVLTGRTLIAFTFGLVAQALVLLFARAFYAMHDTKTPVLIAGVAIILDIVLSLVFVFLYHLPVVYLAVSYSIGNLVSVILAFIALERKVGRFELDELAVPFLKMITAAFVMAISLYVPLKFLDQLVFDTTRTINLIILTGIASVSGTLVYLSLCTLFRIKEIFLVWRFISSFGTIRKVFAKPPAVIDSETPSK